MGGSGNRAPHFIFVNSAGPAGINAGIAFFKNIPVTLFSFEQPL